jgi:hypothetical protein
MSRMSRMSRSNSCPTKKVWRGGDKCIPCATRFYMEGVWDWLMRVMRLMLVERRLKLRDLRAKRGDVLSS